MSAPKIIMAEAANAGGSGGVEGGAPAPAAPPAPPLTDRVPTPRNGINIEYGEGSNPSPSSARRRPFGTLGGVMRGPSTLPDVVVLDSLPDGLERKETLDPKEDLWLSTSDGRYSSPMIPLRVGEPPYQETFYVHKHILTKAEYFKKALCGDFQESETQSIDLPEENPSIFHFLIAYLYEGRYDPIKPIATALDPDLDKGKGKDVALSTDASSDSEESIGSLDSDISAVSRRRHARRRRREARHWDRMRQKHPGMHRPNCNCPTCLSSTSGPPCWACAAPRAAPPHPPPPIVVIDRDGHPRQHHPFHHVRHRHREVGGRPPHRRRYAQPPVGGGAPHQRPRTPPTPTHPGGPGIWDPPDPNGGGRIRGEDLRTWLLAYELNLDVYVLANKFLLAGFKREVARAAIDMLETAGSDAAVPEVLALCRKLHAGLPEADPLLRMVLARVGFLQPVMWRRNPEETSGFLVSNPEIAALILRETVARREEEISGRTLPSMERSWLGAPPPDPVRLPHQQWRPPPRW